MVCVYLQFCWWRLLWHSNIIQIQSLRSPHSCSPTERCPFHPSLLQKVLNHFNMKAVKCLQQSLWWNGEHLKRLPPRQLFIHSFLSSFHDFSSFACPRSLTLVLICHLLSLLWLLFFYFLYQSLSVSSSLVQIQLLSLKHCNTPVLT